MQKQPLKKSDKQRKLLSGYARYTSMGAQMLLIILAGVFGGIYLDRLLKWEFPVFTLVFTLLAVFFSIYIMIREVSR